MCFLGLAWGGLLFFLHILKTAFSLELIIYQLAIGLCHWCSAWQNWNHSWIPLGACKVYYPLQPKSSQPARELEIPILMLTLVPDLEGEWHCHIFPLHFSLDQTWEGSQSHIKAGPVFMETWCDFCHFRQRVPQSRRVGAACQVVFYKLRWTRVRPNEVTKSPTRWLEQWCKVKVFLLLFSYFWYVHSF